ncbi:MAG TPA: Gfo/Idh/MocA family oxidoreductase [Vicinamibacterales bacterium]|nr:Gfo/Idh/MocA family oxidoreductase [Vicinamibacterales bacterium]
MKTKKPTRTERRSFLKTIGGATAALATLPALGSAQGTAPARGAGAKYMGDFAAPRLDKVRIAMLGVGSRGSGHARQLAQIEGTEIVAVSDLYEDLARRTEGRVKERGHNPQVYFGDENLWRKMLAEAKPDAVIIATPWELHAPMAVEAMRAGAHAFIEIPIGVTLDEMWSLVDTSEATGRHCMLMENVCYGREELLYLNMVRQGVIGEPLHGEAAYIHELRGQMKQVERGTGSWRTLQYAKRNGNLYPCHGLGPVAEYMSLARTDDSFGRMVSFSSPARGRALFAKANFPPDHKWNQLEYTAGDINTSIIKTVLGRTIMVQWDETSPRPYSRHNLIQGTKGTLAGFPNRLAIEGIDSYHEWKEGEEWEKVVAQYEHPLFKRVGDLAKKMGGHGGMDFLLLYRIVECLRNGLPLDQNVYEGCFWSAVTPLSAKSIAEDGAPQPFPDFTRGNWKTTKPLGIVA